jgi:hypothetical protein
LIEQYFYIWNESPSIVQLCRPTLKKGIYIKIENELLPIKNIEFSECYKISGETLDEIDETVETILDYYLKILTSQKLISILELSDTHQSLKKECPQQLSDFADMITLLILKKRDYEQLKVHLEEVLRLYQEIEKFIQPCEISKIKNNIEETNQKIIVIKTKIFEISQDIENLNVSVQTAERKLNLVIP